MASSFRSRVRAMLPAQALQADSYPEPPCEPDPAPIPHRSLRTTWRMTVVPLFLLLVCPPLVPAVWVIVTKLDGSVERAFSAIGLGTILANLPRPTLAAAGMIAI